ncbi:MAG: BMP family protein [Roseiflexaceae bacterium]
MTLSRSQFTPLLLLLITALALAGCSAMGTTPATTPQPSTSSGLKVALLLAGPHDDHSWNQSGYEGLTLVEQELGASVAYTEKIPDADQAKIFRFYAQQGYDFVIGLGGGFAASAESVAKEFPRTKFAIVGAYAGNNQNLGSLSFADSEMGYLAGVVAALKSKTHKIAYIGGIDYPELKANAALIERGAKAINPATVVSINWVGDWQDSAKAIALAQAQINAGADVLLVQVDAAGLPVLTLAEQASVYAIGTAQDQHTVAPKAVLTSIMQNVPALFLHDATLVQQGRWEGKQYKLGLQDGVQDLAPFYGLLTPDQEQTVKAIRNDIMLGKINLLP